MKWSHWLLVLVVAAVSVVAEHYWVEAKNWRERNDELRDVNQSLREQLAALTNNNNLETAAELEKLRQNTPELLRLRNEATQLRAKAAEAEKLRTENLQLRGVAGAANLTATTNRATATNAAAGGGQYPRESWAFSGYTTPEAALISAIWAMREGDPKTYWNSLSPEEQARASKAWENKTEADVAAKHQQDTANITGIQVLNSHTVSPDEVIMSVYIAGVDRMEQVSVKRTGDDWKFAGFIRSPAK